MVAPPVRQSTGPSSKKFFVLTLVSLALSVSVMAFMMMRLPALAGDHGGTDRFGTPAVIRMPAGETAAFNGDEPLSDCAGQIVFPREGIATCEGYWRSHPDETYARDGADGLPWPHPRPLPFCGELAWSKRLAFIEARALEAWRAAAQGTTDSLQRPSPAVDVVAYRGLSQSRVDETLLGNKEFVDTDPALSARHGRVCWTGDFRSHYVEKYHVVPSRAFYEYVLAKYDALDAQY